jgi:hypothetical protein
LSALVANAQQAKHVSEALYVTGDSFTHTHRLRINTFALAARLLTM